MISVKITTGGPGPGDLSQFVDPSDSDRVRFFLDDPEVTEADVWIVLDMVEETADNRCLTRPGCKIFVSAETSWPEGFYTRYSARVDYLRQFDLVYTCHDVPLPNVIKAPPVLPWMINGNHGTVFRPHPRDGSFLRRLPPVPKTRLVSMIVSSKTITREQRQRLAFAERLARMLGSDVDWYGNGIRPVEEKWDAIAPYRFHVALENRIRAGIVSEKLTDAFLGWSMPIYWGAPDVHSYFPAGSVRRIDASRPRRAADDVMRILEAGIADEDVEALRRARGIALGSQSFLGRLGRIAADALAASSGDGRADHRLVPPKVGNAVGYMEMNRGRLRTSADLQRRRARALRRKLGALWKH